MADIAQRLQLVRDLMREEQLDAWVDFGSDPHGSEYVAPRWRTRAWLSNFTGSAGTIVITQHEAMLWVDSRYHIQGAGQIANTPFILQKLGESGVVDHVTWLSEHLEYGAKVGVVGQTISISAARTLREAFGPKHLNLVYTDDWFDTIWPDRPAIPCEKVTSQPLEIAGTTAGAKIQRIRKTLEQYACTHTIISSLDDIAWILNLRGADIAYNPVFLSYLFLGEKDVVLFTEESRLDATWVEDFSHVGEIRPYDEVFTYMMTAFKQTDVVYLSPEKTSILIKNSIPIGIRIVEGRDISTDLKACKSIVEVEGMRRAHVLDGIAMVKLLASVDRGTTSYTELSIAETLARFRAEHEEYLGPSFSPIAGFGPHGALAHYSASEETSVELAKDNLLVLDTGGQYRSGTTDITRTLLFGEPTDQMKRDYTLVLKGNLALAAQRFPVGTVGYQLDILARQFLWQAGYSYGHGTGHGVGFCLNVHEGPFNISPKPIVVPLKPGMVMSDEPGIYREGSYGIRLENLVVVQADATTDFGEFLSFDVLTLCPFERRLVDTELLSDREKQMLDAYHQWVYDELSDKLSEADATWLRQATLPL